LSIVLCGRDSTQFLRQSSCLRRPSVRLFYERLPLTLNDCSYGKSIPRASFRLKKPQHTTPRLRQSEIHSAFNLSAAANRLARTQAAVSVQIRQPEDDLGHRLFDRSPRGVTLTEPGRRVPRFCRQALGTTEAGRQALQGA
jgi:hypothetical protein